MIDMRTKNIYHRAHKEHRDFKKIFSVNSPEGTPGRCVFSVVKLRKGSK